jgi:hypothetical protein
MLRHLSGYFTSLTVSINKKICEELCMYAVVVVIIIHQSIQVHNHWIWKLSVTYTDILHKIALT